MAKQATQVTSLLVNKFHPETKQEHSEIQKASRQGDSKHTLG